MPFEFTSCGTGAVEASITRRMAAFAASLTYEALPEEVVRATKRLILDTLGCSLAGAALGEGCTAVIEVMTAQAGPAEASIFGTRTKVSATNAAFANGALTNALNYSAAGADVGHTGIVCLAAQLALAQARAPISGRRFLTAAAVSAEMTTRMSLASSAVQHLGVERLFLSGQYFGYLGVAAGAAAILGLDVAAMHSALGIALMQVAGTRQVILDGDPPAKAIFGAFPNQAGVVAALLAEAGLAAQIDALDGRAGLYALAGGTVDDALLVDQLGTRFRLLGATFKPWPTSAVVTPFIEAAIALAGRHDLHAGDIAAAEIVGSSQLRQWCEPLAERRRPSNAAAAANSTIFPTAKALAHRALGLADFTPAGLRDATTLALTERMTYRADDSVAGGVLVVQTTDGRQLRAAVETPLGHPERPISDDGLRSKFRDCCSFAPLLDAHDVEALIAFVEQLEDADDVSPLADVDALRAWSAGVSRRSGGAGG